PRASLMRIISGDTAVTESVTLFPRNRSPLSVRSGRSNGPTSLHCAATPCGSRMRKIKAPAFRATDPALVKFFIGAQKGRVIYLGRRNQFCAGCIRQSTIKKKYIEEERRFIRGIDQREFSIRIYCTSDAGFALSSSSDMARVHLPRKNSS